MIHPFVAIFAILGMFGTLVLLVVEIPYRAGMGPRSVGWYILGISFGITAIVVGFAFGLSWALS